MLLPFATNWWELNANWNGANDFDMLIKQFERHKQLGVRNLNHFDERWLRLMKQTKFSKCTLYLTYSSTNSLLELLHQLHNVLFLYCNESTSRLVQIILENMFNTLHELGIKWNFEWDTNDGKQLLRKRYPFLWTTWRKQM